MRLLALATTLALASAFALAAFPAAGADSLRCPPPYTGVWVEGPKGPVYMCCNLNEDPIPCYASRE